MRGGSGLRGKLYGVTLRVGELIGNLRDGPASDNRNRESDTCTRGIVRELGEADRLSRSGDRAVPSRRSGEAIEKRALTPDW